MKLQKNDNDNDNANVKFDYVHDPHPDGTFLDEEGGGHGWVIILECPPPPPPPPPLPSRKSEVFWTVEVHVDEGSDSIKKYLFHDVSETTSVGEFVNNELREYLEGKAYYRIFLPVLPASADKKVYRMVGGNGNGSENDENWADCIFENVLKGMTIVEFPSLFVVRGGREGGYALMVEEID